MLHFHIKQKLTRPIETIEIRYNDDDILNYDCILSTSALCYYISKMNKQAKLYIRTNNDLGQCLHHSIATQYINQVEICQSAENKLGETEQQFEFKNGKVYFTETPKIISSQHYNPKEFRFKIYTEKIKPDLIITDNQNKLKKYNNKKYKKITFKKADFDVTGVEFKFEGVDESTKQEQEKNTKKIWDEIDIKMNRARGGSLSTAWSVFEDFFKKIFGVSLTGKEGFEDIYYCLKKKDTKYYIPFDSSEFMENVETQLVNIIQKIKDGNTSSFGASPKSTLLPIINDGTPQISKLFSIAMAWYCNILSGVKYINTEQFFPISFEYTRPATVFSIENIIDSIDFPEIQPPSTFKIAIQYSKGREDIDRDDFGNLLGIYTKKNIAVNNKYIYLMFLISQFFNTRGNWIENDVKEFLKNLKTDITENRECKVILGNLLHTFVEI